MNYEIVVQQLQELISILKQCSNVILNDFDINNF